MPTWFILIFRKIRKIEIPILERTIEFRIGLIMKNFPSVCYDGNSWRNDQFTPKQMQTTYSKHDHKEQENKHEWKNIVYGKWNRTQQPRETRVKLADARKLKYLKQSTTTQYNMLMKNVKCKM